jgi:hypothetical protein
MLVARDWLQWLEQPNRVLADAVSVTGFQYLVEDRLYGFAVTASDGEGDFPLFAHAGSCEGWRARATRAIARIS